ncbi:MAG: amidohydrolase family protein [Holophaga sp.]|nr:amidohydrolase family protein [Holophaga sp.]
MAMQVDVLIRGGEILDPAQGVSGKGDVAIRDGRVVAVPEGEACTAAQVLNAEGCLVLPGLIDFHAHVFPSGTSIGIHPDSSCLCQGVTTVVDQGSAGVTNFESFMQTTIRPSQTRIFAYLHVSPAGLATLTRSLEPVDPRIYDLAATRRLMEKYPRHLLGLKIRQSSEIVGDLGLAPLAATVGMAEALGCGVVVHTTHPPSGVDELAALLRPGDVYTHVYQGKGHTILDASGKVRPGIRAARARGVLFDTADGRGHYAFQVIRAALADGFGPDVISTDVVHSSLFADTVFGLPFVMTKYLNLGLPLFQVVEACTSTPARLLGMPGVLGTLAPGALADVAIFRRKAMELPMQDVFGEPLVCTEALIPQATVHDGNLVYRSLEF